MRAKPATLTPALSQRARVNKSFLLMLLLDKVLTERF